MAQRVIRLLPLASRRGVGSVTVRRSWFALLGAMLAIMAMLGLTALSTWHSAVVHDGDPIHAASIGRINGQQQPDPDGPIHVAAHATGQWLALAEQSAPSVFPMVSELTWAVCDVPFLNGREPAELLRPPRG